MTNWPPYSARRTSLSGLVAMLCVVSSPASADIEVSGSATFGFSSGYQQRGFEDQPVQGAFGIVDLSLKWSQPVAASTIGLDLDLDFGVSDLHLPRASILDDFTLYLDTGAYGRLSFTSENRCTPLDVTFIDGDILDDGQNNFYQGGDDAVHDGLPSRMRCVGDAGSFNTPTANYLRYTLDSSFFTFDAFWNPGGKYTTWQGRSLPDTPPFNSIQGATWELGGTAKTDLGQFSLSLNDLNDMLYRAVVPWRTYNLMLVASHEVQGAGGDGVKGSSRTLLSANWSPPNLGSFKGIGLSYQGLDPAGERFPFSDFDRYVIQINFGGSGWSTSIATDQDADWAVESSFDLNERLQLLVGVDSGFSDQFTGFDSVTAGRGANGAPPRDAVSYEVGLQVTF